MRESESRLVGRDLVFVGPVGAQEGAALMRSTPFLCDVSRYGGSKPTYLVSINGTDHCSTPLDSPTARNMGPDS